MRGWDKVRFNNHDKSEERIHEETIYSFFREERNFNCCIVFEFELPNSFASKYFIS